MNDSCHRPFLPGTSLEPAVISTAQASSFTLQYFPYYYYYYYYFKILGINIRFKRHFPLVRVSKLVYSYEEHVTTHPRQSLLCWQEVEHKL